MPDTEVPSEVLPIDQVHDEGDPAPPEIVGVIVNAVPTTVAVSV